ncbi:hypothetical protein NIES806_15200 [Dolichospermum compactum NIES-806]|uniref:Uncharacterized protein n=1 Tax=Dolichospermum compactum NIES-806 TaxID=1973481 RepID=A0A1Z4V1E6_9CYAN|nr:hypothetical protein NIES806_15200 [Dolichospermum compactum NIES-806]
MKATCREQYRKAEVKSQKSKRRQYRLFGDLEWLVCLRRVVVGERGDKYLCC